MRSGVKVLNIDDSHMLLEEQIGTTTLQSQRSAGSEAKMDTLITNKDSGVRLGENLIDHSNGGGATS